METESREVRDTLNEKVVKAGQAIESVFDHFGKHIQLPEPFIYPKKFDNPWYNFQNPEYFAEFWYHSDHLGSSSYITNLDGEISQHMEYLPFGETLVEEHLNSNNSPYKFNAKEFDAETGNYYYGARYYDPKWSIWLSVDPLAEKFPGWTPYHYVHQNPIKYIDPDGMEPIDPITIGIIKYVSAKVGEFKNNTASAVENLHGAVGRQTKAAVTGQQQTNAKITPTGISTDAVYDAGTISESLKTIGNEAGSIAKDVTRDVANTMEVVGDGMVIGAPTTGPAAPLVAGTGATISGIGTTTNISLDLMDGDVESAIKRGVIKTSTFSLSTLAKNAPGVDESTSRIIDALITSYENIVTSAIEGKIEDSKD